MKFKTYGPGSELFPRELNEFQDEYIDGAYTPWTSIGGASFYVQNTYEKYPLYGYPNAPGGTIACTKETGIFAGWLSSEDYPDSYNDVLRSTQLRVVANVSANAAPAGSLIRSISLRRVNQLVLENMGETGFQKYTLGIEYGKIVFPRIVYTLRTVRYNSPPINFPAAGLYTIEVIPGVADSSRAGLLVHAQIQRRSV